MATKDEAESPLEVVELLEMVLSHLTASDITRCQRISKFWRNVITGSHSLKPIQFLKPIKKFETIHWVRKSSGYVPCILPSIRPLSEMWVNDPLQFPIVQFHPILLKAMTGKSLDYKTSTEINVDIESLHDMEPGPWLDMLISQPPVDVLQAEELTICAPSLSSSIKGGLTFRNLLKKTIRRREKYVGKKFAKVGYKTLWRERNELRVLEEAVNNFKKPATEPREETWCSQYMDAQLFYQEGWTRGTAMRKLEIADVLGEHTIWVQYARGATEM